MSVAVQFTASKLVKLNHQQKIRQH